MLLGVLVALAEFNIYIRFLRFLCGLIDEIFIYAIFFGHVNF